MARPRSPARQRLIDTAKRLFAQQGITQTTTRQIAEGAEVNEVTLFRNFGTKQGLLLAVFADLGVFDGVVDLQISATEESDRAGELKGYVKRCFQALARNPELVRSVVGEAGYYSDDHRQALQQGFTQAQAQLAQSITETEGLDLYRGQQASVLLHVLILGMAVLEVTAGLPPLAHGSSLTSSDSTQTPDERIQVWLDCCIDLWLRGLREF